MGGPMPGIARVGWDSAGGRQLGGGQDWARVDGALIVVRGGAVASHPPCPNPAIHCSAQMVGATEHMRIDGIPVVRAGDAATCGHPSTGSDWASSI